MKRKLTDGENRILEFIQLYYGDQNSLDKVFWLEDGAGIFVSIPDGSHVQMAHLTNLAMFCEDGTIENDDDLKQWLNIQDQ